MTEKLEGLKELPGPYELLDLPDGGEIDTPIKGWELGQIEIHPGRGSYSKWVKTLRIYVKERDKEFFPYYWDITSQTLIAQLIPWLQRADYQRLRFHIQKFGGAPRARFTLRTYRK